MLPQSLHQLLEGDAPSCGHCIFTFITLNKGNGDRVRKSTTGHYGGFKGRGICFSVSGCSQLLSVDQFYRTNVFILLQFVQKRFGLGREFSQNLVIFNVINVIKFHRKYRENYAF